MKPRQGRNTLLLLVLCTSLLLACFPRASVAQEEAVWTDNDLDDVSEGEDEGLLVEDSNEFGAETIQVDDYLATLTTQELQKICWDRGFEVDQPDDDETLLTRDDYLEAARRCLSLEEEMNAILNEHPELAAEIEKEITRLQEHKDRLEQERATLFAEKEILEAQLEQAGVDLAKFREQANAPMARKDPADMSFPELFVESLRQLSERVKQDFVFVFKITKPFWQSAKKTLDIGWRHSKPAILHVWRYTKPILMQTYTEMRKRVKQVLPDKHNNDE